MRFRPRVAALRPVVAEAGRGVLVAVALVATVSAILLPGAAQARASTSQNDVSLSYLGSDTRPIPKGWTVTACPRGASPDLVSLTCNDGEITFQATAYARGVGAQKATVAFTTGGVVKTRVYTLSLQGPELTIPAFYRYRYPLPQGTPTTVPYNTFHYTCQSCATSSPEFRSGSVTPGSAGTVRFSGTGVVFSPAPDFWGRARLHFRLRDRYGDESARATVKVTVVPGQSRAPTTIPVTASGAATVKGDATARDIAAKGYPAILSSCGTPFHGHVTCARDGSFVYTPDRGFRGYDEFGTHVFVRRTGDQAVGAVLVRVGGAPPTTSEVSQSPLEAAVTSGLHSSYTPILSPLKDRNIS